MKPHSLSYLIRGFDQEVLFEKLRKKGFEFDTGKFDFDIGKHAATSRIHDLYNNAALVGLLEGTVVSKSKSFQAKQLKVYLFIEENRLKDFVDNYNP